MRGVLQLLLTLPLFLAVLAPVPARAAPVACGDTITESVTLTEDLVGCPVYGLIVGASNIVIDGNGHMIEGSEGSSVGIWSQLHSGLTITNATIQGFEYSIDVHIGDGTSILDSSFDARTNLSDSNNTLIQGNVSEGEIQVAGSNNTIIANDVSGAWITVQDGLGNVIEGNTVTDGGIGIGSVNQAIDTRVVNNDVNQGSITSYGWYPDNNVEITDNNVSLGGIVLSMGAVGHHLIGNTVSSGDMGRCSGCSYHVTGTDNELRENVALDSHGHGFLVEGPFNLLSGNEALASLGFGFYDSTTDSGTAGTGNTYESNTCSGNLTGPSSPLGLCENVGNAPPSADAGWDQTVHLGEGGAAATLDGTSSFDPDGDPITYQWTGGFDEGTATGPTPTVTFSSPGNFEVTLTVEDDVGATDTDTVLISVIEIVDTSPPDVTAELVRVTSTRRSGTFIVSYSCIDDIDPSPDVTATLNGVEVTDGQEVNLTRTSGSTGYQIRRGVLHMRAPSFELVVTCVDESGNEAIATAEPSFGRPATSPPVSPPVRPPRDAPVTTTIVTVGSGLLLLGSAAGFRRKLDQSEPSKRRGRHRRD